jgi:hypothetical protein
MMYEKAEVIRNSAKGLVEVGGLYGRMHEMNISETAEVIALCDDYAGVPHVRFSLVSSIGPRVMDCGVKTLGITAFLETYKPCGDKDVAIGSNVTHLKSHI